MHDLQLVGFTTDRRGLIFRTGRGARGDSYVVPLTDELVAVVAELAADAGHDVDDLALAERVGSAPPAHMVDERPRSMLSVRDIQSRLRAGEPTAQVAAEAGVEEEWIERFAPPVRAEQRRVVERALECRLERPRAGQSAVPLRRAVGIAMADKGIAFTLPAFDAAWSSHLIGQDRWAVEFTYRHRSRDHRATWIYDAEADELTTSDRTASQIGYVPATAKVRGDAGVAVDGIVGDPGASTQIGVAEPEPKRRRTRAGAPSAPADDAPAERAAKKKAPSRTKGRAASKKGASKKAASKKAPATKRATTKRAATKKGASKRAPATKRAATKKGAAKKRARAKKRATENAPTNTRGSTEQATTDRAVAATPAPTPASARPAPEDDRLRVRSRRPSPGPPDVAPRAGAVDLADVPLAPSPPRRPAPAPTDGQDGNGRVPEPQRPPELERIPDDPDVVDSTASRTDARRARAAERSAPTVQFRSGSAVPVRRADPNGGGRTPSRRGQLRAR